MTPAGANPATAKKVHDLATRMAAILTMSIAIVGLMIRTGSAETANDRLARSPSTTYPIVKAQLYAAFNGFPPMSSLDPNWSNFDPTTDGRIGLVEPVCGYEVIFGSIEGAAPKMRIVLRLKYLASHAIYYQFALPRVGFRADTVKKEIEQLEAASLLTIGAKDHWVDRPVGDSARHDPGPAFAPLRRFADNLMQVHRGTPVPKLLAMGGMCGAGEVEVVLRSMPPGGQIYIIEVFNYRICNALEADMGEDLNRCEGWQTVHDKAYPVAGTYRYKIAWRGQPISRSQTLSFKNVRQEGTVMHLRVGPQ